MLIKSSSRVVDQSDTAGKAFVSVDPFRCRMWAHHERLEDHLTEESCHAEIDSYSRHGQLVPVLGRPLKNDPRHDVELIYGARRLFAARHLKTPVLVELRDMTDKEAVVAMEIENHHRQSVSPYERGLCFAKWLQNRLFDSQDDIARTINVSKSQVSRYLKLTKLPSVVLSAFGSPTEICESWGADLIDAWEDPQRQRALARRARAINADAHRPHVREVYRYLMDRSALPSRNKESTIVHDEVVKGRNGDPLFRIRRQRRSIALCVPVHRISQESLQEIRTFLADLLRHATEQPDGDKGENARRWRSDERARPVQSAIGGTEARP